MEVTIGARSQAPLVGALADRRRTADRIFRGALLFNTALTLFWAVMAATGGDAYFFGSYGVTAQRLIQVLIGIFIFNVLWGFIWYGVKTLLLRRVAGFRRRSAGRRSHRACTSRTTSARSSRGIRSGGSGSST
jgi:uncharacterized membrane protein YgcG